MLKKRIDRDSSVILSVNLVKTVSHEQIQIDSEDMNFVKSDPSSPKLKNSDILNDLDQKRSILVQTRNLKWNRLFLNMSTYFRTFHPELTKFIMMSNLLMIQNV